MEERYTITDIEFLISTQNKDSLEFLKPIFKDYELSEINVLIINQTNENRLLKSVFSNIRVINSFETGVAKSRNLALKNAKSKIVVFTDDDVEYFQNTRELIVEAYNSNNNPDAILFQVQKNETKLLKKYPTKTQDPISTFSILNCGTIEVTLKNKNLDTEKHKFDENFGLKSFFELGDEPLFLMSLKRDRKRILFVNKTIVQHESNTTSDKNSLEKNYFGLGAFYKKIFPKHHYLWLLLKLFFDLKHKKITLSETIKALKFAKQGRQKLVDLTPKTIK